MNKIWNNETWCRYFLCVVGIFVACLSLAGGQSFAGGAGRESSEAALAKLRVEDNPDWKAIWDKSSGAVKRLFHAQSKVFPGKPQEAARAFLSSNHGLFGLSQELSNLQIKECAKTPLGERVVFRQYHNQIPIMGAEVTVSVSDKNRIFFVENSSIQNVKVDVRPDVEKDKAIAAARAALSVEPSGVEKASSELVILPSGSRQHLAWRVIISKKGLIDKAWLVYVDAKNGWVLLKKKLQSSASGSGKVYKENPITTPSLAGVTLKNLDGGSTVLAGDYGKPYNAECLESVDDGSSISSLSTVSSSDRNYSYSGGNNKLEEVMAYYHVNTVHDTLKSLFGFSNLDGQMPLVVNAQDPDYPSDGYDNAFYTRDDTYSDTGFLLFGCGNELNNLGLDADVINHEYGHAVLDHIQPDLYETYEHNYTGAIHESTGDVMASYFGSNEEIGEWGLSAKDGTSYTRHMNNTRSYPGDVYEPSFGTSEEHYTGEILNGVYWNIQEALGADTAFRLYFSAIHLISGEADFFDMRDAWVTADGNLYGGKNTDVIEAAFANHGIEGDDPGNADASLKINKLVFYKYDPDTDRVTKQTTFQRGDEILVYGKAFISNLTPAYNLIATSMSVGGNGAKSFHGSLNYEEALEGTHEYMLADLTSNSARGKITVKIKARLGGTDKEVVKTGTFTIK